MKTDDLIAALSADPVTMEASTATRLKRWVLPAVGIVIVLHFSMFQLRPDLSTAIETPRYLFKLFAMLVFAGSGAFALVKSSEPGATSRQIAGPLSLPVVLLIIAAGLELAVLPATGWASAMKGDDGFICLTAVPVMTLAPLVAGTFALRSGASTHPRLSAIAAAFFAGGVGGAVYALHCPNDSPLYVIVWYFGGILIGTALSLAIVPRFLRW